MAKSKIKIIFKKVLVYTLIFLGFAILLVAGANVWVISSTSSRITNDTTAISAKKIALVLGTSKFSRSGNTNKYFVNRISAAGDLFKSGKASHFILSGDNSLSYYNEPQDMKKYLMEYGVPEKAITLDYAGFRTFDSVVRAKEIFGQSSIIIISQEFHLYRAIFIADQIGLDATGFAAANAERNKYLVGMREILARFLAVLDLFVFNEKPKFLGEKEKIIF